MFSQSGNLLKVLKSHTRPITGLALLSSPSSSTLAYEFITTALDGCVKMWKYSPPLAPEVVTEEGTEDRGGSAECYHSISLSKPIKSFHLIPPPCSLHPSSLQSSAVGVNVVLGFSNGLTSFLTLSSTPDQDGTKVTSTSVEINLSTQGAIESITSIPSPLNSQGQDEDAGDQSHLIALGTSLGEVFLHHLASSTSSTTTSFKRSHIFAQGGITCLQFSSIPTPSIGVDGEAAGVVELFISTRDGLPYSVILSPTSSTSSLSSSSFVVGAEIIGVKVGKEIAGMDVDPSSILVLPPSSYAGEDVLMQDDSHVKSEEERVVVWSKDGLIRLYSF